MNMSIFYIMHYAEKKYDFRKYISNNDFLRLYDKHDLESVSIIKGAEAFLSFSAPFYYTDNYEGQNYSNQLYEAFINNPYKYFDSFLFNEEYSKRLFPFIKNLKISRVMRKVKNKVQKILDNGPKDLNERHLLMKYLKDNIDLNDEKQKRFILDILDNGVVSEDYEELAFLCNYVSKWMLRETKNDDIDLIGIPANFYGMRESGGFALDNLFFINSENNDLCDFLKTICHETQHVIQREKRRRLFVSDIKQEDSFVGLVDFENKLFRSFFEGTGEENYFFSRNEYDAEINGIKFTYNFLSFFGKNILADDYFGGNRYNNSYETGKLYKLYLEPICSNGKIEIEKEFAEYALVSMWNTIIKTNSKMVKNYPIFQKFYDLEGNQLPFDVMINNDLSEGDNLDYYYDYIFNYIQCGALDNYDLGPNHDVVINNLYLIYDRVLYRVRDLVNFGTSKMGNINYQFAENGYEFSKDEIKEIFNAEIIYYFSFLTKITKYLYNSLNNIDRRLKLNFSNNIEILFQLLESAETNHSRYYGEIEGLDSKRVCLFLDENRFSLLPIYNDIKINEIRKIYHR